METGIMAKFPIAKCVNLLKIAVFRKKVLTKKRWGGTICERQAPSKRMTSESRKRRIASSKS